jgi:hypothetical protein
MTPIEIMAFVVIGLSLIKLTVVLIKPEIWMRKVVIPVYGHKISIPIFLALAGISLYYLLQELSIVQIMAVMFFFMFLFGLSFMMFAREFLPFVEGIYRDRANIWRKSWFVALIWLALIIWTISALIR